MESSVSAAHSGGVSHPPSRTTSTASQLQQDRGSQLENKQSGVCIRFVRAPSSTELLVGVWGLLPSTWLEPDEGVWQLLGDSDRIAIQGFGSVSAQDYASSTGSNTDNSTLLIAIIAAALILLLVLLLIMVVRRRRQSPQPGGLKQDRRGAYTNAPLRMSLSHLAATSPLTSTDLDAISKLSSIDTWERGRQPEVQDLYSVAVPKSQRDGDRGPALPVLARPPMVQQSGADPGDEPSEYAEIDEVMGRRLPAAAAGGNYASADEVHAGLDNGYETPVSQGNSNTATYAKPRVPASYYQAEPGGQVQAPTIPVYDHAGQVVGFTLVPGAALLPDQSTMMAAGDELYEAMPVRQQGEATESTIPIYDQSGAVVDRVTLRKSCAELPWDETTGSRVDTLKSLTGTDTITSFNDGFIDSPSATLPGFRSRSFTTDVTSPAASGRKVRPAQPRLEEVREAGPTSKSDSLRSSEFGFASSASTHGRPGHVLNLDAVADAPMSGVTKGDPSFRLKRTVEEETDQQTEGETGTDTGPTAVLVPATAGVDTPVTCLFGAIPRSTAEQMLAQLPAKSYLVRRKPGDGENVSMHTRVALNEATTTDHTAICSHACACMQVYAVSVKGVGVFIRHLLVLQPSGFTLNGVQQATDACTLSQAIDRLRAQGMPLQYPVEAEGDQAC